MTIRIDQLQGDLGVTITSSNGYDTEGVSAVGDVNGDGFGDFVVTGPTLRFEYDDGVSTYVGLGGAYLVFGQAGGLGDLDTSQPDGVASIGLSDNVQNESNAYGYSYQTIQAEGLGDINGDGFDDFAIIYPNAQNGYVDGQGYAYGGVSHIIFGTDQAIPAIVDLNGLDGSGGVTFSGPLRYGYGYYERQVIAGVGDVNGDGFGDLLVDTAAGKGVLFGTDSAFPTEVEAVAFDGVDGFLLTGDAIESAAILGDFNDDGVDDLFVLGENGTAYIVNGDLAGFGAEVNLQALDGAGFRITPGEVSQGASAIAAADVNGDGLMDAIFGASDAGSLNGQYSYGQPGAAFVLFGRAAPLDDIDLEQIADNGGVQLSGLTDASGVGRSVFAAGDVNDDGVADFGFTVSDTNTNSYYDSESAIFVIYGDAALSGAIDLDDLTAADSLQVRSEANADAAQAVGVGDANGDGIDDILFNRSEGDAGGPSAPATLFFGSSLLGGENDAPVAADDDFTLNGATIVDLAADNGFGADLDPDLAELTIATIEGQAVSRGDFVTLENGVRVVFFGGTEVKIEAPSLLLGQAATADFDYTVSDGELESAAATATVSLTQSERLVATLDGVRGFTASSDEGGGVGRVVANLGDINGDGVDDLGIAAPFVYGFSENFYNDGAVFVLFGDGTGFDANVALDDLDGTNGFRLSGGFNEAELGVDLSAAGDVNGDGIDDFLVSTRHNYYYGYRDENSNARQSAFVIFGDDAGFADELNVDDIDGTNGFEILGPLINGFGDGAKVAAAGDVNGDGFDDLIIGEQDAGVTRTIDNGYGAYTAFRSAGSAHVIFGEAAPASLIDVNDLDGSNGFSIIPSLDYQDFAVDVSGIGDVNGDGVDDLAIVAGAYEASFDGGGYISNSQKTFVIFGKPDPDANPGDPAAEAFAATFDPSTLDGTNGFAFAPPYGAGVYEISISGLGDFNGDGIDDFIVAAPYVYGGGDNGQNTPYGGRAYVIFGSNTGFDPLNDLSQLDGSNGFVIAPGGADSINIGRAAAGGDLNNDGYADIVISTESGENGVGENVGRAFVIYGSTGAQPSFLTLDQINGSNGFSVASGAADQAFGRSVAAIDINDDGRDDLVVGEAFGNSARIFLSGDFDSVAPFVGIGDYEVSTDRIATSYFSYGEGILTFDADAISPYDGATRTVAAGAGAGSTGAINLIGGAGTLRITAAAPDGALYDTAAIRAGVSGGTGEINVLNGAELISRNRGYYSEADGFIQGGYYSVNIGRGYGAQGVINVDGAGSFLAAYGDAPRVTVGRQGGTGELNISNGGVVGSLDIQVGRQQGADGLVTISGAGSTLISSGVYGQFGVYQGEDLSGDAARVSIGRQGGAGQVSVTNGGAFIVENTDGVSDGPALDLGRDSGSYGRLDVSGAGSTATLRQNGPTGDDDTETAVLAIGRGGDGVLNVGDGGALQVLGEGAEIIMGDAFDTSTTQGDGALNVYGGGTVTIDAGTYRGGFLTLGRDAGAASIVTVDGAGSRIDISGLTGALADEFADYGSALIVGRQGFGQLDVTNGGVISIDGGGGRFPAFIIGRGENDYGSYGHGNVRVSGAGSEIIVDGDNETGNGSDGFISVGRNDGTLGDLFIENGGAVRNLGVEGSTEVGGRAGSEGLIIVTGDGSILEAGAIFAISSAGPDNAYDLYDGGVGVVYIQDGGVITAGQTLLGQDGVLNISGGQLQSDLDFAGAVNVGGFEETGVATIIGDVNQFAGSVNFEVFGFGAGLFDTLEITGNAVIDASLITLDLSPLGAATVGDSIAFLAVDGALTIDETLIDLANISGPAGAGFAVSRADVGGVDTLFLDVVAPAANTVGLAGFEKVADEGAPGETTVVAFTVVRAGALDQALTLDFSVAGSGDDAAEASDFDGGALPAGQVVFAAGEETATVEITLVGDDVGEGDEGFTLTISNPQSAAVYEILSGALTGTIRNDDAPASIGFENSFQTSDEGDADGGQSLTFTIGRDGGLGAEVTVDYVVETGFGAVTADADDLLPGQLTGSVTFGVGESEADFALLIAGEQVAEIDEDLRITITGVSGDARAFEIGENDQAFGRIYNDDGAVVPPVSGDGSYSVARSGIRVGAGDSSVSYYDNSTNQYVYNYSGSATIAPTGGDPLKFLTRNIEVGTAGGYGGYAINESTLTISGADQPVRIHVSDVENGGLFSSVRVGLNGATGTLNLLDGAQLSTNIDPFLNSGNDGGYYTVNIGRRGTGVMNIDGAGSFLSDNGFAARITVGRSDGGDGTLNITNGGGAGTTSVNVGRQNASGVVTVDGVGSVLNVSQSYGTYGIYNGQDFSGQAGGITLGRQGGDGRMAITAGGVVTVENTDGVSDNAFVSAGRQGAYGRIDVSGAGSTLNVVQNGVVGDDDDFGSRLIVGRSGDGVMRVDNGGAVNVLGDDASLFLGLRETNYGYYSASRLEIYSGGVVTVDSFGYDNGSFQIGLESYTSGEVIVSGAGSELNLNTDLSAGFEDSYGAFFVVGRRGEGTLTVENGGAVNISGGGDKVPSFQIARGDADAYDAPVGVVTVTGAGSEITLSGTNTDGPANSGFMSVARRAGGDGSLYIRDGGAVRNTGEATLSVIAGEASSTARVEVTGAGSVFDAGAQLGVSVDFDFDADVFASAPGGEATIVIGEGAALIADQSIFGDTATLDFLGGALQSVATVSGEMNIGGEDAVNSVLIEGGLTQTGGEIEFEFFGFGAGQADLLTIDGDADIDPLAVLIDLNDLGAFSVGDQAVFLSVSGVLTLDVDQIAVMVPPALSGFEFDIVRDAVDGNEEVSLIVNAAPAPTVGFVGVQETAIEGDPGDDQRITFTVERSGGTTETLTLDFAVSGVTADGGDFEGGVLPSGQVLFAAGQSQATVEIAIAEDVVVEVDDTFTVSLSNPVSNEEYVITNADIDGVIVNDDAPGVVSIVETASSAEGDAAGEQTVDFTLTRDGNLDGQLDVAYVVQAPGGGQFLADAADLAGGGQFTGVATFADGSDTATISVSIAGDTVVESDETFTVTLTSLSDSFGHTFGNQTAVGTIENDDGTLPIIPVGREADIFGDPHLVTLDGLGYDFQAAGEFTLVENTSGADLNVQVRTEPVPGSDLVSVITAMATDMGQGASIMIDAFAAPALLVDGVATEVTPTGADPITVGDGQVFFDGETYIVVFGSGEALSIKVFDGFMNVCVFLDPARDNDSVRGLLGNANGDLSDDFALRDGSPIPESEITIADGVPSLDFDFLYGAFADSWRITDDSSLFVYSGETGDTGTADYTNTDFPVGVLDVDALPQDLLDAAEAAVDALGVEDPILREAAILDFALTGDENFAAGASGVAADPIAETTPDEAPALPDTVGVIAGTPRIAEGDSGSKTLIFNFYRIGEAIGALDVEYAIQGQLDAADFAEATALSGAVSFGDGEASASISFSIAGDLTAEAAEKLIVRITGTSNSDALIGAPTAATTILNDDNAPVAFADAGGDALTTNERAPLAIDQAALTANDVDADNDDLTVVAVDATSASGGSVSLSEGVITYDPLDVFGDLAAGAEVTDTFTYTVSDGLGGEDAATATITIVGLNDGPTIGAPPIQQFSESAAPIQIDLDAFILDAEQDPITFAFGDFTFSDGDGEAVAPEALFATDAFALDGETNIVTIDPNALADFFGLGAGESLDSGLQIIATDAAATGVRGEQSIVIPIFAAGENDGPTTDGQALTTNEDAALTGQLTAADIDGDALTFAVAPTGAPANGSLTLNADGSFTYTPNSDFNGEDAFVYTASDGLADPVTATVTIAVAAVNDAPVANDDAFEVDESQAVSGSLFGNDSDVDSDFAVSAVNGGGIGASTLASGAALTVNADGTFIYDPNGAFDALDAGETATDQFTYTIRDASGATDTATVTLTVNGETNTTGTGGADEFVGGGGADLFDGGGGADTLSGGGGLDTLIGGGGRDLLSGGGGGDDLSGGGGGDTLEGNGGKDLLNGGGGKDLLQGGGGKDTLIGGGGKDTLEGGGGRDLLQGGGGRDFLDGQGGKDTMEGGNGRDEIVGGRGSDILTGNGGRDVFIFGRGDGRDTITDFSQGQDKIRIEDGAESFGDLTIVQAGADVRITFANVRITVEDDLAENFEANDFIF